MGAFEKYCEEKEIKDFSRECQIASEECYEVAKYFFYQIYNFAQRDLKEQNDILSETVRNLNCRLEILQEQNLKLRNCQNCSHEFENVRHCNPYTNERDKWEMK